MLTIALIVAVAWLVATVVVCVILWRLSCRNAPKSGPSEAAFLDSTKTRR